MENPLTDNSQQQRPRPTVEDMVTGGPGAGDGYIDQSYIDAVKNYGHWNVERIRATRRPFGSIGTLTENPFLKWAAKQVTGFEPSESQGGRIHHAYIDTILRNPETGERVGVRVEKGPRAHATVGGGTVGMGLETSKTQALDLTHALLNRNNNLTFKDFSKRALESHAHANAGDYSAIGRYNIAGGNCQNFSLQALEGSGLLDDKRTKQFLYEPRALGLSKPLQGVVNDYVYGRKGVLNPFAGK